MGKEDRTLEFTALEYEEVAKYVENLDALLEDYERHLRFKERYKDIVGGCEYIFRWRALDYGTLAQSYHYAALLAMASKDGYKDDRYWKLDFLAGHCRLTEDEIRSKMSIEKTT